jgi:DNA-binding CsgD family transcriptional regulator
VNVEIGPAWLHGVSPPPLVGRAEDLRIAAQAMASARAGTGRVFGLEGSSGVGKTRLLEAIVAEATGFEVMRASGSLGERGFALGVARDLFASLPDTGVAWPTGEVGDVIRALVQLTLDCAARRPTLVALDDLQWADDASLRFIAQLASRVEGASLLILLAWRPAAPDTNEVDALFGSVGERAALAPLGEEAIGILLERALPGWGRLAPAVRAATAGNAMLAVELCRGVAGDVLRPVEELIASIPELAPPAVARTTAHQLASHGSAAGAVARAVAVLGSEARLRTVATVAGLELEETALLSDELTSVGLLAAETPLAFAAPVVRNAVYQTTAPGQRALLHLAAAQALNAGGAAEGTVVDHLMLSEPADDPSAARLLRRAAREARSAGDLGRATRLLRRALAEPPPATERGPILLELGLVESSLLLPDAESHLDQAWRIDGGDDRCEAALALADLHLLTGRVRDARELLELERARLDPGDADAALRFTAELEACGIAAGSEWHKGWWRDGIAETAGATSAERARLVVAAAAAALEGETQGMTVELAERGLARGPLLADGGLGDTASMLVLAALQTVDEPSLTLARIDAELRAARAGGSVMQELVLLTLRARALLARGELRPAEADASYALALCRDRGLWELEPFALAVVAESLLDQGRLADAERALRGYVKGELGAEDLGTCLLMITRGRLQATAGESHLGIRTLLGAGTRLLRSGFSTPAFAWRSRAGLLAHRLDHGADAVRLIEDELTLAVRLGAREPIGRALRAQALISPRPRQVELLQESVETLRGTPAKLDCARALCELGAALRRSGSRNRGREPLEEALQLAHECDAVALAQRARHELIALGARPRRHAVTGVEALTARERQASELAAQGLTNRQIAATMTVTPNTVEYHLTNAFRKLGITTRSRLAAELGVAASGAREADVAELEPQARTA